MSLRGFHILFIIASIILLVLTSFWAWQQHQIKGGIPYLMAFGGSLGLTISLIIYEIKFTKNIHEPR
jgi:uncharacterized YccA/Bax inhibitor family protein